MRCLAAAACLMILFTLGACIIEPVPGGHYHGDGCGHYYWHSAWWDYPHPEGCARCRPVADHIHAEGCGHFYWHDAWWDYPHSGSCARCRPVHVHCRGCGHYYWHHAWWDYPHPADCHG